MNTQFPLGVASASISNFSFFIYTNVAVSTAAAIGALAAFGGHFSVSSPYVHHRSGRWISSAIEKAAAAHRAIKDDRQSCCMRVTPQHHHCGATEAYRRLSQDTESNQTLRSRHELRVQQQGQQFQQSPRIARARKITYYRHLSPSRTAATDTARNARQPVWAVGECERFSSIEGVHPHSACRLPQLRKWTADIVQWRSAFAASRLAYVSNPSCATYRLSRSSCDGSRRSKTIQLPDMEHREKAVHKCESRHTELEQEETLSHNEPGEKPGKKKTNEYLVASARGTTMLAASLPATASQCNCAIASASSSNVSCSSSSMPESVAVDCSTCSTSARMGTADETMPKDLNNSNRKWPNILVIAGPSGVGKGTLVKRIFSRWSQVFGLSVSHTTRQAREGEVHGREYFFCSREVFEALKKQNVFLESASYAGHLYGTSYASVNSIINSGRICVLEVDLQGVRQVQQSPFACLARYIFVEPPSISELERRLRGRKTEDEKHVQARLRSARQELDSSADIRFDMRLVNDDLEQTWKIVSGSLQRWFGPRLMRHDLGQGQWEILRGAAPATNKQAAGSAASQ